MPGAATLAEHQYFSYRMQSGRLERPAQATRCSGFDLSTLSTKPETP